MANSVWQMLDVADVPAEMRASVDKQLEWVRHLVPAWCQRIRVYYKPKPNDDERDYNASIEVNPEYRTAHINLLPNWLELSEDDRHHTLVHELAHFPTIQLHDLAESIIKKLVADENVKELLLDQLRLASEAATEDLALMILRAESKM